MALTVNSLETTTRVPERSMLISPWPAAQNFELYRWIGLGMVESRTYCGTFEDRWSSSEKGSTGRNF